MSAIATAIGENGGVRGCAGVLIVLAGLFSPSPAPADDHTAMPLAVADFDYRDTSGEVADQTAAHAARVKSFTGFVRDTLAANPDYRLVRLDCKPDCSVSSLGADGLIAAARQAGARLLVYGGIHKMSTLVQWGEVQVVDLAQKKLLLSRTFTFRGDTDLAYRRAADFIGQSLASVASKP